MEKSAPLYKDALLVNANEPGNCRRESTPALEHRSEAIVPV